MTILGLLPDLNPKNHHEVVATLWPGDDRTMLLAVLSPDAARAIARQFNVAREVETGTFRTHKGREFGYSIWAVQGFRDYVRDGDG